MQGTDDLVRVVAMVCLAVIISVSVVCITVVAVMTDRDLRYGEGLLFLTVLLLAVLGGFSIASVRRRRRWRLEREDADNGGAGGVPR